VADTFRGNGRGLLTLRRSERQRAHLLKPRHLIWRRAVSGLRSSRPLALPRHIRRHGHAFRQLTSGEAWKSARPSCRRRHQRPHVAQDPAPAALTSTLDPAQPNLYREHPLGPECLLLYSVGHGPRGLRLLTLRCPIRLLAAFTFDGEMREAIARYEGPGGTCGFPDLRRGRYRLPDDVSASPPVGAAGRAANYFNVGCSDMIVAWPWDRSCCSTKSLALDRFVPQGAAPLRNGTTMPARPLVVGRPAYEIRNRSSCACPVIQDSPTASSRVGLRRWRRAPQHVDRTAQDGSGSRSASGASPNLLALSSPPDQGAGIRLLRWFSGRTPDHRQIHRRSFHFFAGD